MFIARHSGSLKAQSPFRFCYARSHCFSNLFHPNITCTQLVLQVAASESDVCHHSPLAPDSRTFNHSAWQPRDPYVVLPATQNNAAFVTPQHPASSRPRTKVLRASANSSLLARIAVINLEVRVSSDFRYVSGRSVQTKVCRNPPSSRSAVIAVISRASISCVI
jgi:hypothetical protein